MAEHQDESVRIDYGLRIECDCGAPHEDNGEILPRGNAQPVVERINGHKVVPVQRTVTYSAWQVISPAPCRDCGESFVPVRRGECSRCGSDAGPRTSPAGEVRRG